MAIQTLSDLKALINSTIYDNTTNEISGSDVQTALINAIDTLDSAEGFINVHKANGQTTISTYGSKAAARAAVPSDFHYQGIVIAYKLSTGWVIEQNLDATAGTWSDDASWVTTGPVSVSQNTLTIGGTAVPINLGSWKLTGKGSTIVSVSVYLPANKKYTLNIASLTPSAQGDQKAIGVSHYASDVTETSIVAVFADETFSIPIDLEFVTLDTPGIYKIFFRGANETDIIFSLNEAISNELSLQNMEILDEHGYNPQVQLSHNYQTIAVLQKFDVTHFINGKYQIEFIDKNDWTNQIGYNVAYYDRDMNVIGRSGYILNETIQLPINLYYYGNKKKICYVSFSFGLRDSNNNDIGGHQVDYHLENVYIKVYNDAGSLLLPIINKKNEQLQKLDNYIFPMTKPFNFIPHWIYGVTYGQGCACYNGYLFVFRKGNEEVYVYNVSDGTLLQTITMPNPSEKYHNNNVNFGSEKYDEEDAFPLLYASQEHADEHKCLVYRITGTEENFVLTVVQTITFPTNDAVGLYYQNCYVDTANNLLLVSGARNMSYSRTDGNTLNFMAYKLPTLNDGSSVQLAITDILYRSRDFIGMPTTQGGFCKGGFLYQAYGVDGPKAVMMFDIKAMRYVWRINADDIYDDEPQSVFLYNNKLYVFFHYGSVFSIN